MMREVETSSAGGGIRRASYRVRQFAHALHANLAPLSEAERAEIRGLLPETAHGLFDAMPSSDQRHSLRVARALRARGYDQPALLQAALLHDCAKYQGGIRLWHRVAIVLMKGFKPALPWAVYGRQGRQASLAVPASPARGSWRYPFWVHLNHGAIGAGLAAQAGCDPAAVYLIRAHQDSTDGKPADVQAVRLLSALQAADDDS